MPKKIWLKGKKRTNEKSEWEMEDATWEKEDTDSLEYSYDDTTPREDEEEY